MNKIIFAFLVLPALIMQIQVADLSPKDLSCSIDTKPDSAFKGRYYNKEFNIYIDMDLYHQNKLIPGQEFLGEVAGYLGDNIDSRKWIFTDVTLVNNHTAKLSITNDYGSEDLKATLTHHPKESTYVLKQEEGSAIKIARNRKWVKLPNSIIFK